MPILAGLAQAVSPHDSRDGPLPAFLLVLTFITGLVDAVSYLKFGHVFVANMTGNVVFLGFAMADAQDFSIASSLLAIGAFLAGAALGGRLGASAAGHRGRYLALATYVKIVLVATALAVSIAASEDSGSLATCSLIVLLAVAMGLQNAVVRRLGVPDLTTTVLTMTLTGLGADSSLAGAKKPQPAIRRVVSIVTMFLGALIGALVVLNVGVGAALALVLILQVLNGIGAHRISSSTEAWTVGI